MEKIIEKPDFDELETLLNQYLTREFTITLTGLCTVNYKGRAKSKLDRGERMVIKKQDSAILVHGPDNYQPKNWQPEVDKYEVKKNDEVIVLTAKRNDPDELVEIKFEEVELVTVNQLVDKSELQIAGHETDIHEAIEETPDIIEEDLKIIKRERETPAGFIDVFARDSDENYVVIEVKRNPDFNTVLQLQRYVQEIQEEFKGNIRGMLVAPKISDNVLDYLTERDLEYIEVEMSEVISSYQSIDNSQRGLTDFRSS